MKRAPSTMPARQLTVAVCTVCRRVVDMIPGTRHACVDGSLALIIGPDPFPPGNGRSLDDVPKSFTLLSVHGKAASA